MHAPGGPEMLKIEERAVPRPQCGQVLIRGGTTSVGLTAVAIAKVYEMEVAATSRSRAGVSLTTYSGDVSNRRWQDRGAHALMSSHLLEKPP